MENQKKSHLIQDIEKFTHIQKLKFTYRYSGRTFGGEMESTADHSWCCLVVSDYLLAQLDTICPGKYNLDKLKIHELIMYHDLLEAETGDVDLDPRDYKNQLTKAEIEKELFPVFLSKIPEDIQKIYTPRIEEYEQRETLESHFVKLVDVLEAEFQCFGEKIFFEEWTQEYFIQKREKYFLPFPELYYIFDEILEHHTNNEYFK